MEWVNITGKTVDEATQQALEQLGVDDSEAEVEVLEEPRPGLFGRLRGEARVRARVAPKQPRPKQERRPRRKSGSGKGRSDGGERRAAGGDDGASNGRDERPAPEPKRESDASASAPARSKGTDVDDVVAVAEQADIMERFLGGLLDAFAIDGEVERTQVDEDTIELAVTGDELGLLIGLRGQTLGAVQDLARTYLQRQATGTYQGRVRIDVGGYRQRRREALERFVNEVAEAVRSSSTARALEPMGPADRKIVHDTVNGLDGVHTVSEGAEPRRRVVILPDED